ncbi:MAG: GFA family protein [Pseudomonadota bacterium]
MTKAEGGCSCGATRYRLSALPMFVHCCHCTWCQRETGAAFAVNGLIERSAIDVTKGELVCDELPTHSGTGQSFLRCSVCHATLWTHYSSMKDAVAFLKVGTLDDPDLAPPDIHIFTSTKQDWVVLGDDKPVMRSYYRRSEHWPEASIERLKAAKAAAKG